MAKGMDGVDRVCASIQTEKEEKGNGSSVGVQDIVRQSVGRMEAVCAHTEGKEKGGGPC